MTCAGLFCLLYLQSDAYSFALHIKHFISVCRMSVWFSAFRKATVQAGYFMLLLNEDEQELYQQQYKKMDINL